jgi:hypothetical protein
MNLYWVIINTGLTVAGISVHEILRNYYPETYLLISFSLSYNAIYLFSVCQKYTIKITNEYIKPACIEFFKDSIVLTEMDKYIKLAAVQCTEWYNYVYWTDPTGGDYEMNGLRNRLQFVKNGDVVYSCSKTSLHDETLNLVNGLDYDFILDNCDDATKIYYNFPSKLETPLKSNADFILIEFGVGDEKLEIKFHAKDESYNYVVVGNKIDHSFLLYFIRRHYLDKAFYSIYTKDTYHFTNYTLKIIDDKVNIVTLGSEDSIVFTDDSYVVQYGNDKLDDDANDYLDMPPLIPIENEVIEEVVEEEPLDEPKKKPRNRRKRSNY